MDISDIVSDSIKYPSSSWVKVFMLGIIIITSFLVLPMFLIYGYILRIIKATIAGIDELPDFDGIGEMFIDGIKMFLVAIIYAIPVGIIGLLVGLLTGDTAHTGISLNPAMLFAFILGYIVYIIIAMVIGLIEVIAIANMAYYDGDLGAAFRFNEILDHIARIGWEKYIATYIVIAIIGMIGFVIGALTLIILIGILLIIPYLTIFGSRAIALLFKEAIETTKPLE
ncbi:MAG: DUF4013 domain-containing protein [Methanobacterium sp.]|nr:DUF4013 domain-containing protein [Methanobacterium sp.]